MSLSRRVRRQLRNDWGSPFVVVFMITLVVSGIEVLAGASNAASEIIGIGSYCLIIGIALQVVSLAKFGDADEPYSSADKPELEATRLRRKKSTRRTRLALVAAISLMLVGSVAFEYPVLFPPNVGPVGSLSVGSSSSGCGGARNDGTIFIDTNVAVSIDICGETFQVQAGQEGGLTYTYHSGLVTFSAPSVSNGSQFEYWYAILGKSTPQRINTLSFSLNLPAGLDSQSSLIDLVYSVPMAPITTSVSNSTSTSTSTSSSSLGTTTSTLTSSSSTQRDCRGGDGSFFLSTNINDTALIDVCGEQLSVNGGVAGGLDYNYNAGNLTLVAPTSVGSKTFEYWSIFLPSLHGQITSNQAVLDLPPGYAATNAIVVAFYG